jgi:signal transduction histidine kinase/CheY-like chemotaxis protein
VLTARPDCLRCHQGSKEGEILGGISVSQDAAAYLSGLRAQTRHMRLLYGLLGLTGMLGIGGATLYLTRRRWLAEETSRLKGDLLARLGHDMRTPLTAMLGMTELLRRPELRPPEKARALNYLAQAGGALLEMVGDITDHAALERAAPALRVAPFGLRACLGECLALYRPVAEAKGLFLRLNVPDDVPDAVTGDGFRLRQALGNLVSNAVKFTEQGGVRVDVRARPGGRKDRDLRCSLAVTDTGPGLRPEEQERVFASFQRGEAAASCPGTGLGLGMARRLARRMGGDVSLRSRPGEGACFTLEIHLRTAEEQDAGGRPSAPPVPQTLTDPAPRPPMAAEADLASPRPPGAAPSAPVAAHCADAAAPAANAPDSPADAPPAATAALNGLRVLLAEDNPATAYYLQHMLTRAGAATRLLADGEAALALLRDAAQGPWDILLLDACLPGRSGLEVLEAVRAGQTAAPQDQKILLCTASPAMTEAQRRAAAPPWPTACCANPAALPPCTARLPRCAAPPPRYPLPPHAPKRTRPAQRPPARSFRTPRPPSGTAKPPWKPWTTTPRCCPVWPPWPRRTCGRGPTPWRPCRRSRRRFRSCAVWPTPARTRRAACAWGPCAGPPPPWSRPVRRTPPPPAPPWPPPCAKRWKRWEETHGPHPDR